MKRWAIPLFALSFTPVATHADDANSVSGSRASPPASTDMPRAFFPAALADHVARDEAAARELERLLDALPGVEQARVSWLRADPSFVPLDQPLAQTELTVMLQITGNGPDQTALDGVLGNLFAAETPRPSIRVLKSTARSAESARFPTFSRRNEGPASGLDWRDDRPASPPFETNQSPFRTVLAVSLAANVLLATVLLLRART